jgi:hypothetical protein
MIFDLEIIADSSNCWKSKYMLGSVLSWMVEFKIIESSSQTTIRAGAHSPRSNSVGAKCWFNFNSEKCLWSGQQLFSPLNSDPRSLPSKFTFHPRTLFKCFDSKFRRSPLSPGIPQQALFSMKALRGFGWGRTRREWNAKGRKIFSLTCLETHFTVFY